MAEYPPYQSHGRYVSPNTKHNPYSQVRAERPQCPGTGVVPGPPLFGAAASLAPALDRAGRTKPAGGDGHLVAPVPGSLPRAAAGREVSVPFTPGWSRGAGSPGWSQEAAGDLGQPLPPCPPSSVRGGLAEPLPPRAPSSGSARSWHPGAGARGGKGEGEGVQIWHQQHRAPRAHVWGCGWPQRCGFWCWPRPRCLLCPVLRGGGRIQLFHAVQAALAVQIPGAWVNIYLRSCWAGLASGRREKLPRLLWLR